LNPRPHKSHSSFYARVPSLVLIPAAANGQATYGTSSHERFRSERRLPTSETTLLHRPFT